MPLHTLTITLRTMATHFNEETFSAKFPILLSRNIIMATIWMFIGRDEDKESEAEENRRYIALGRLISTARRVRREAVNDEDDAYAELLENIVGGFEGKEMRRFKKTVLFGSWSAVVFGLGCVMGKFWEDEKSVESAVGFVGRILENEFDVGAGPLAEFGIYVSTTPAVLCLWEYWAHITVGAVLIAPAFPHISSVIVNVFFSLLSAALFGTLFFFAAVVVVGYGACAGCKASDQAVNNALFEMQDHIEEAMDEMKIGEAPEHSRFEDLSTSKAATRATQKQPDAERPDSATTNMIKFEWVDLGVKVDR